mmetsp:Transcript_70036/g.105874  ORF Transcript_70036/g.105874 Transcript_70036/m.105874 type:complete len:153 (-) Transcript_70036:47-505(-)
MKVGMNLGSWMKDVIDCVICVDLGTTEKFGAQADGIPQGGPKDKAADPVGKCALNSTDSIAITISIIVVMVVRHEDIGCCQGRRPNRKPQGKHLREFGGVLRTSIDDGHMRKLYNVKRLPFLLQGACLAFERPKRSFDLLFGGWCLFRRTRQ